MAKDKEYTHDAEAILAHYRVDKPCIQMFPQAVASLGNTSSELTSTNPTMTVPFVLFDSFSRTTPASLGPQGIKRTER